jgi:hypothetical protein
MALHQQLPIYKVAYELLDLITDLAKNMPRDFKVSIGGTLRDEVVKITVLVFRANVARAKAMHLESLIERLQVIELLLRLSRDKRLISTGQYARSVELTDSIGKQAGGWRRSALSPAS